MSLSVFGDKSAVPGGEALAEALAGSAALWDAVKRKAAAAFGALQEEWKFYSAKAGWSFVLKSGKRTVLYMIPQSGYFKITMVFGERAAAAALNADLPEYIRTALLEARPYAEGRGLMFDVKDESELDTVTKLMEIKRAF